MANALYPKFKERCLKGGGALDTADVKAVLVDLADYTYSAAHEFLSDIPAGARVATSAALASKVVTNGVFDADNATFSAVTGDVSEALVLYVDTGGADTTDYLIAYIDTATGLPVTPNSGDIAITWDNGANKIFAL